MALIPTRLVAAAVAAGMIAAGITAAVPASARDRRGAAAQHVLLISVDGLHQTDLAWYTEHHPGSALDQLVSNGTQFTNAHTPFPSDSFPGLVGQVTGGNPSSTGIYYDDSWNAALLPAGTHGAGCATAKPGVEVTYFEQLAKDPSRLDSGQGLPGLPDSILNLTSNPDILIDPAQLPVDPASCQPVFPHSYLKVNTVFEVARAAGLRTAWSDKHAAYEVLNGPSGTGVQDFFTPEINSNSPIPGKDWTKNNRITQQYDGYKVQAVINEINGLDHRGQAAVGTPAIFGMNFQSVSTAQKLPRSDGEPGGYLADGVTPGPVLTQALDYINTKVGAMVDAVHDRHLDQSTAIILSAKHGQSPDLPSALTRIPDGPIIDALNAAWHTANPTADNPLVAFSVSDGGMLIWLNDRSQAAADFAQAFLLSNNGTNGNDINAMPKSYTASGLREVFAGQAAADYFKVQPGDPRVPDVVGIAQYGTVYTGGHGKIAEHGGANPQDRDVPLVVSGASVDGRRTSNRRVETTQIAPTILQLLGLNPNDLMSVGIEGTKALPLG